MAISPDLKAELLAMIPNLRAFAFSLSSNADLADDLVQETLMKAWHKFDSYEEGTNLKAWLFTILRNTYFSQFKKSRREIQDTDGDYAAKLTVQAAQQGHLDVQDLIVALDKLTDDQREALLLVAAEGFSYEEAAEIADCALGTIKSRVNRARGKLAEIMQIESVDDFNIDTVGKSVAGAVRHS